MSSLRYVNKIITPDTISIFSFDSPKQSTQILSKSRELLRSLYTALNSSTGHLPTNFSLCESMVCIEIACKILGVADKFSRDLAVQKTGATDKEFQSAFQEVVTLLNITFPIKFDDLCLMFGCSGIASSCEAILTQYKEGFVKKHANIDLSKTDFSKPIFKVVAFFLTATHQYKFKVDQKKLIQETKVNSVQFHDILTSMKDICNLKTEVKIKGQDKQTEPTTEDGIIETSPTDTPKRKRLDLEISHESKEMGLDETKITLKKRTPRKKETKSTIKTSVKDVIPKESEVPVQNSPGKALETSSSTTEPPTKKTKITPTATSTMEKSKQPTRTKQMKLNFFK